MMESKPGQTDFAALKSSYEREAAALRTALINGASWDEVKEQRVRVTQLAIEVHRKLHGGTVANPAERSIRSED